MTMAEKVLARASGRAQVRPGETLTARADKVMAHEAFTLCALQIELDLATGGVRNPDSGAVLQGEAWNADMLAILEAGGLLEVLKRRVAAAGEGA